MLPIPELPERIKKASSDGKLAIFIGAGVSRLMGCKDWRSLALELIDDCYKAENIVFDFRAKEHLEACPDNKRIVSICYELLGENRFMSKLRDSFSPNPEKPDIYAEIAKFRGLCITTNADTLLAEKYYRAENILSKAEQFAEHPFDRAFLYQIHGSISIPDSLVFTVRQYIDRYRRSELIELLKFVFSDRTILFVGYGLSEFELFDYLIPKTGMDIHKPKHVMLEPYYDADDSLLHLDNLYYRQFNIEVLGYSKNRKGYDGLYEVLSQWNRDIEDRTGAIPTAFREIDALVP